jgi:hypothetical protein
VNVRWQRLARSDESAEKRSIVTLAGTPLLRSPRLYAASVVLKLLGVEMEGQPPHLPCFRRTDSVRYPPPTINVDEESSGTQVTADLDAS